MKMFLTFAMLCMLSFSLLAETPPILNTVFVTGANLAGQCTTEELCATHLTLANSGYFISSASTVGVSSSSTADDIDTTGNAVEGTGAFYVKLTGLDSSYNAQSEIIELDGQTVCVSTLNYIAVNKAECVDDVGTGLTNAGTIYVSWGACTSGVPAANYTYRTIPIGYGEDKDLMYCVPANKELYISDLHAAMESAVATAGQAAGVYGDSSEVGLTVGGRLMMKEYSTGIVRCLDRFDVTAAAPLDRQYSHWVKVPAKSYVYLLGTGTYTGKTVGFSASLTGYLKPVGY